MPDISKTRSAQKPTQRYGGLFFSIFFNLFAGIIAV